MITPGLSGAAMKVEAVHMKACDEANLENALAMRRIRCPSHMFRQAVDSDAFDIDFHRGSCERVISR